MKTIRNVLAVIRYDGIYWDTVKVERTSMAKALFWWIVRPGRVELQ